jgi:molecular chaperone DnaJ
MDFYLILGLERTASTTEIKRAYRRLARRFHPDINPGDQLAAAHFHQISEAYETLSDPDRRGRYDRGSLGRPAPESSSFGFEGFDFSVSVSGASAPTFGDLFADLFQPREQQPVADAQRGPDLHASITLSFAEALAGGTRQVTVTRQEHCRACHGLGRLETVETRCPSCGGAGTLKSARGHMVFSKMCRHCSGTGKQAQSACPVCDGRQVEMRAERLTVHVPAGLEDGGRVRVAGKGHAGRNGGEPGDLIIVARVEPHPFFRREGDDIHIVVPIAIHEAALGARIEVPALEGHARVRVPPGTQTGQRFRLRERGAPSVRTGRRGDLVVEVRLVLPRVLDERSKELLREFGRIQQEDVRRDLTI